MISILVPSFQDHMIRRLFTSMEQRQPGSSIGVIVLDNGLSDAIKAEWPYAKYVQVPHDPFVATIAFNIGFRAVPYDDIVILGADVEIQTDDWAKRIEQMFRYWPFEYGLLTFAETTTRATYGAIPPPLNPMELPTIALASGIAMPRRVLNQIGPWDESFVGYGYDDFDYSLRLLHAGYRLGIAGDVILHTASQASAWVERLGFWDAVLERQDINARIYHQKWFGTIPPNLRDVNRPVTAEHFNRTSCSCRS